MHRHFYPLFVIFSLFLFACGKKDLPQPEKDPLKFSIEQIKDLNTGIYPVRYELRFKNESDSGENISYRWRFGDGGTADGYNTRHAYVESGNYTVWLTKYKAGLAVDSNNISIKVDAIPIVIRRSDKYSSIPIGIGAHKDKIFLAGFQSYDLDQIGYREGFLTQYDSLWREKWTKVFPLDEGIMRHMSITADGDVLVSMVLDQGKAKLHRIDGNGNVKWTWISPIDNMWIFSATEDKQGNIVMMATKPIPSNFTNVTIQLNAAGKENWIYEWTNSELGHCDKLVTVPDGYIMTGYGSCREGCLHIAKLSLDGKNVWNNTVPLGKESNYGTDEGVYTALDHSNQLKVVCGPYYTYHTFDLNGQHLGSHELGVNMAPSDLLINMNGSMLTLGNELPNSGNSRLLEYKPNGEQGWSYSSMSSINDLTLVKYPQSTRGIAMALTDDNEALITGRFGWGHPEYPAYTGSYAIFVCRIDANGKLN